ncbi:MAG: hypothetical protein GEU80_04400 [Dehalococcoidia bacterium]|nr:hypothetical protein [Dehalococcoidia bacterium]
MRSRGRLGEAAANARFLAVFRIAVGAVAVTKGAMLLGLGREPFLVALWVPLGLLVLLGWRSRWAAAVLLAPAGYVAVTAYQNHVYLLWLLLVFVVISDGGRYYVLRVRPSPPAPLPLYGCSDGRDG